jgi:hypothetical protein
VMAAAKVLAVAAAIGAMIAVAAAEAAALAVVRAAAAVPPRHRALSTAIWTTTYRFDSWRLVSAYSTER